MRSTDMVNATYVKVSRNIYIFLVYRLVQPPHSLSTTRHFPLPPFHGCGSHLQSIFPGIVFPRSNICRTFFMYFISCYHHCCNSRIDSAMLWLVLCLYSIYGSFVTDAIDSVRLYAVTKSIFYRQCRDMSDLFVSFWTVHLPFHDQIFSTICNQTSPALQRNIRYLSKKVEAARKINLQIKQYHTKKRRNAYTL